MESKIERLNKIAGECCRCKSDALVLGHNDRFMIMCSCEGHRVATKPSTYDQVLDAWNLERVVFRSKQIVPNTKVATREHRELLNILSYIENRKKDNQDKSKAY